MREKELTHLGVVLAKLLEVHCAAANPEQLNRPTSKHRKVYRGSTKRDSRYRSSLLLRDENFCQDDFHLGRPNIIPDRTISSGLDL